MTKVRKEGRDTSYHVTKGLRCPLDGGHVEVGRLAHGTHRGHPLESAGEVEALEDLQRAATPFLRGHCVPCNNTTATKTKVKIQYSEHTTDCYYLRTVYSSLNRVF